MSEIIVSSGVTSTGVIVSDWDDKITILNGGIASNTTFLEGSMVISSGGVANSTTLNDGSLYISSGGVANNTIVSSFYSLITVNEGGLADGVLGRCRQCVLNIPNGGVVKNFFALAEVRLSGCNGGSISFAYTPWKVRIIDDYGKLPAITYLERDADVYVRTMLDGGYDIRKADYYQSLSIANGVEAYVFAGGEIKQCSVSIGGRLEIHSGAVVNGFTLQQDYTASDTLAIQNAVVKQRAELNAGGTAENVEVHSGGRMMVGEFADADGVTVQTGGSLFVLGGGYAEDLTVTGGGVYVMGGGEVAGKIAISQGGSLNLYGGSIVNGEIHVKGELYVDETMVNNGSITVELNPATPQQARITNLDYLAGTKTFTVATAAAGLGTYTLANGATDYDGTVSVTADSAPAPLCTLSVGETKTVGDTDYTLQKNSDSLMLKMAAAIVAKTGAALYSSSTLVSSAATMTGKTLTGGSNNEMRVYNGGVAHNTIVNEDGELYISSGGTANSTTVNSSGYLEVYSGGTVNSTTVNNGGYMELSGGIANSVSIAGNGRMVVYDGQAGNLYLADNGRLGVRAYGNKPDYKVTGSHGKGTFILSNGVASGFIAYAGGDVDAASGGVCRDTILMGGGQYVFAGGSAHHTVVDAGRMTVEGYAGDTELNSGTMRISSGGTANSTTVHSGGQLFVSSGGKISGSLQIVSGATVSAYQGAIIDFTVAEQAVPSKALINNWSLISGGAIASYTITVNASQAAGTYVLAGGAAKFANTVTVQNTAGNQLGTVSVGNALETDKNIYTLTLANDILRLNVQENTPRPVITITADSATQQYNGTALTAGGYSYSGKLADGDELVVTVSGSITDAGTAANKVTSYKVLRGKTDVTKNYTFNPSVDGTLTVTKRDVTLASASDRKSYDGKPLTNSTVTVSGEGFVSGEGATYTVTGSQTSVGSSANSFTYKLNSNTKAGNYNITTQTGTLTVEPSLPVITITAASYYKVYDGKALTVKKSDYTYTGNLTKGDKLTVTVSGTITDAGTAASEVTSYKIMRGKLDVTDEYLVKTVDGELTVDQCAITLTSADAKRAWNGKELTAKKVKVTSGKIGSGDKFVYSDFASLADVGSCDNTFTCSAGNAKTDLNNYNITFDYGTLTITYGAKYAVDGKVLAVTDDVEFKQLTVQNGGELRIEDGGSASAAEIVLNRGSITGNTADCEPGKLTVSGKANRIAGSIATTSVAVKKDKNTLTDFTVEGDLALNGNFTIDSQATVTVGGAITGVKSLTLSAGKNTDTNFTAQTLTGTGNSLKVTVGNYGNFSLQTLTGTSTSNTVKFGNDVDVSIGVLDLKNGKNSLTAGNNCEVEIQTLTGSRNSDAMKFGNNTDVSIGVLDFDAGKDSFTVGNNCKVEIQTLTGSSDSDTLKFGNGVDGRIGVLDIKGGKDSLTFGNQCDFEIQSLSGTGGNTALKFGNEFEGGIYELNLSGSNNSLAIGNDCDVTVRTKEGEKNPMAKLSIGKNTDAWLSEVLADFGGLKLGKGSQVHVIEDETGDDLFATAQSVDSQFDGVLGGGVDNIDFFEVGSFQSLTYTSSAAVEIRLWRDENTSVVWTKGADISQYAKFSVALTDTNDHQTVKYQLMLA